MSPSAQSHLGPDHAGGQLGPVASGSSRAKKRPKRPRNAARIRSDFVFHVGIAAPGRHRTRSGAFGAIRAGPDLPTFHPAPARRPGRPGAHVFAERHM